MRDENNTPIDMPVERDAEIAVEEPGVPALSETEGRSALWNRIYSALGPVNRNNRSSWADELEVHFEQEKDEFVKIAEAKTEAVQKELSTTKLEYAREIDTLQSRYQAKCKELDKAEETYTSAVLLATEEFNTASKSALTEIGELKARITELEAEADKDQKIKQDIEKELSETRAIYARMASEHEVVKRDAAQFRTRTATAEEHARKLYDVIESLASIGRNL